MVNCNFECASPLSNHLKVKSHRYNQFSLLLKNDLLDVTENTFECNLHRFGIATHIFTVTPSQPALAVNVNSAECMGGAEQGV